MQNSICITLIIGITLTIFSVVLGFTKKVVFYSDYNDLGLSLSVFAIPVLIGIILLSFGGINNFTMAFLILIFSIIFLYSFYKTFQSNNNSIAYAVIIMPAKLILSFLYILYLFTALTGKKRSERGLAWFVLAILTPILLALVHTQEGRFKLPVTSRSRII